jgi:hypothetical protein
MTQELHAGWVMRMPWRRKPPQNVVPLQWGQGCDGVAMVIPRGDEATLPAAGRTTNGTARAGQIIPGYR